MAMKQVKVAQFDQDDISVCLSAEQPGGFLCVLRYLLHHNRRPNVLKLGECLGVVVLGDGLYTVSDTCSLIHIANGGVC